MGEWRSYHSSNQSSSVSLSSTFSPPSISLSPPPNAFFGRPPPPHLRPIYSLTLHLMANTSMQFPPLAHLAIPLFSSQVLIILIIFKKRLAFLIGVLVLFLLRVFRVLVRLCGGVEENAAGFGESEDFRYEVSEVYAGDC